MRKFNYLLLITIVFSLIACSGSEMYRGNWKATDSEGKLLDITFEPKTITIKEKEGEKTSFSYSQNSINIKNNVETYKIELKDGRVYEINFPIADDESVGIMKDGNGNLIYTISRNDYITYDDIYSLN